MDWERWIVFYGEWVAFGVMLLPILLYIVSHRRNPGFLPVGALQWLRAALLVVVFGCGSFLLLVLALAGVSETRAEYRRLDGAAGQHAPEIPMQRLDGSTVSLSDFEGQVLLLNLWAPWCGPCVGEMPDLARLQRDYGARGLAVAHLSQAGADEIDAFREAIPTDGEHLRTDAASLPAPFDASMIPTTILIDRRGLVRQSFLGPRDYAFSRAASTRCSPEVDALGRLTR